MKNQLRSKDKFGLGKGRKRARIETAKMSADEDTQAKV